MESKQRPHCRRASQEQKCKTAETCEKEHRDEGGIHAEAVLIGKVWSTLQLLREEPCRAYQNADSAGGAEHDGGRIPGIGGFPAADVMIEGCDAGRRKTQQKAIKGQVVIELEIC